MRLSEPARAVTFDVGGTLIAPWPSVGCVYAEVARAEGGPTIPPAALDREFALAWTEKSAFDYSRAGWLRLVTRCFRPWLAAEHVERIFPKLYDRFAQPDVWQVFPDVLPTLEELIRRDIELGLISNWDERLRPLLRRLKLDRYFRVCAISHEIGFTKPSSVIFQEAARKFACPAIQVLHIGDSTAEDLEGARAAGLQGLHLDRTPGAKPNLESGHTGSLRSLHELITALDA